MPQNKTIFLTKYWWKSADLSSSSSEYNQWVSGQSRKTLTSKLLGPAQSGEPKRTYSYGLLKATHPSPTTDQSKMINNSDLDTLTSAFSSLTSEDYRTEKDVISETEQSQPKWNHEIQAAALNTNKIILPPPKRQMFFKPNINANTYQKRTIARRYHERREVDIELANHPDSKSLINPADLIPKVDPKIQAQRDAFAARCDQARRICDEREGVARPLREKKSEKNLARREEAFRKAGRFL